MWLVTAFLYYLLILPISLLPLRALHRISDGLYYLIYYGIGYRKKVVRENLRRSFPEKSSTELSAIEKQFFRHFCDLVVESLKMFTVSKEKINQMITFLNPELLDPYFKAGRNVILCGGHFNNWEVYAVGSPFGSRHQPFGVYKPLQNKWFDKMMRKTRGKFGLGLISMAEARSIFLGQVTQKPWLTILGMDQSPGSAERAYWMEFLHQDTAVFFGPEKYARDINAVVVFGCISRVQRGTYTFEYRLISDHPNDEPKGYIIETAMHMLERDIQEHPAWWLWSHKRWKLKRPIHDK